MLLLNYKLRDYTVMAAEIVTTTRRKEFSFYNADPVALILYYDNDAVVV